MYHTFSYGGRVFLRNVGKHLPDYMSHIPDENIYLCNELLVEIKRGLFLDQLSSCQLLLSKNIRHLPDTSQLIYL